MVKQGINPADTEAMHVGQWDAYSADYLASDTLDLLRLLEKAIVDAGLDWLTGSTAIMIAPGFNWRIVNRIVTNFHQPQSTLLLLVGSFLGLTPDQIEASHEKEDNAMRWREIYDEALAGTYRFLSYGDACLFSRN